MTDPVDPIVAEQMIAADPLGAKVNLRLGEDGRSTIAAFHPALAAAH
jgi:hypothetical protein